MQRGTGSALVHEWISRAGGSENVLHALSRVYPESDLICLWNDDPERFPVSRTRETLLARPPLRGRKALTLPLAPIVWRTLPFGPYDWAILSSHSFAHHARFRASRDIERFVYVHSPARYIWTPDVDARGSGRAVRAASALLRPLDRKRAHEGASFAANSRYVQQRIADTWEVDARVIHPPVAVEAITAVDDWSAAVTGDERATLDALPEQFVLGASRFIEYKRLDEAIRTAEAVDLPVVLAGAGPLEEELRGQGRAARVPVHFVIAPSNALLRALFARCFVYVFPAVEDFGIMPVEALAAGAPVLAQAIGGTAEIIEEGRSGALSTFGATDDLRAAVDVAVSTSRADRVERAERFSEQAFETAVRAWTGR